ncbi:unnamed protein product [Lactuca virosa]|uniref:Uncharacterized protein n=1 Tax=Lactuca virosa TaxID=75947 RepID=A0AAU9NVK7_9ASTR|nr:unnamed protein product [Lactuca virosa]
MEDAKKRRWQIGQKESATVAARGNEDGRMIDRIRRRFASLFVNDPKAGFHLLLYLYTGCIDTDFGFSLFGKQVPA